MKVPLEEVGKHLEDHVGFWMSDFSVNDTSILRRINSSEMEKIFEDFHNGTGILTAYGSDITKSFLVSSKADPDWPDFRTDIYSIISVDEEPTTVGFVIFLGRPKSIGTLTMDANKYKAGIRDDTQLALIDYQALTHPDDIEVLLEGIMIK